MFLNQIRPNVTFMARFNIVSPIWSNPIFEYRVNVFEWRSNPTTGVGFNITTILIHSNCNNTPTRRVCFLVKTYFGYHILKLCNYDRGSGTGDNCERKSEQYIRVEIFKNSQQRVWCYRRTAMLITAI